MIQEALWLLKIMEHRRNACGALWTEEEEEVLHGGSVTGLAVTSSRSEPSAAQRTFPSLTSEGFVLILFTARRPLSFRRPLLSCATSMRVQNAVPNLAHTSRASAPGDPLTAPQLEEDVPLVVPASAQALHANGHS